MEFFKTIKRYTIDHLLKAKPEKRDEIKGKILAEEHLYVTCKTFENNPQGFSEEMRTRFLILSEGESFRELRETNDPREETKLIAKIKHLRKLHKHYLEYAKEIDEKVQQV